MSFNHLIGNREAARALDRILKSKNIPSTLLFHGPEGVGKSTFAHAFVQTFLGREGHPDLLEIRPEGKLHSMAALKELIHEASLPPFEAAHRFFIIYDAHAMLPAHSNALLKTLEEPHEQSHFILITHDHGAILPTICSRSLELPFYPITKEEIAEKLEGEHSLQLALLSEGSLGRALRLQKELPYDQVIEIIKAALSGQHALFFQLVDTLEKSCSMTPTLMDDILSLIAYWYRDLHLIKRGGDPQALLFSTEKEALNTLSSQPVISLESLEELLGNCIEAYRLNFKPRHILERILLAPA